MTATFQDLVTVTDTKILRYKDTSGGHDSEKHRRGCRMHTVAVRYNYKARVYMYKYIYIYMGVIQYIVSGNLLRFSLVWPQFSDPAALALVFVSASRFSPFPSANVNVNVNM